MKLKKPRAKFILMKRCPFCRGAPTTGVSPNQENWVVGCMKHSCQARGPIRNNRNLAIKAWNKAARESK